MNSHTLHGSSVVVCEKGKRERAKEKKGRERRWRVSSIYSQPPFGIPRAVHKLRAKFLTTLHISSNFFPF